MKIFGYEFFIRKTPLFRGVTGEEKKKGVSFGINLRTINRESIDIDDWLTGLKNAESVLHPRRKKLYDNYFHVIIDDDYVTATGKRKSAITSLNLQYLINDKVQDDMDEFMKNPSFRDFKNEVMDTIFWGYSLFEFYYKGEFNPYSNKINTTGSFDYHLIPRKHVSPRFGEILENESNVRGYPYREEFKENMLEFGKIDDLGLLLIISIPVIYKRNSQGDWAQYSELAGNNFRSIKMIGTDRTKREHVLKAINDAGSSGLVAYPEGVELDFIRNSSQSSNQLFENFNKEQSNDILRLILGQSGTTADAEGGSYARAKVSLEVEKSVHDDDKVYFLDFMNYKFRDYLPRWGFSDKGKYRFEEIDPKTRREKVEEDKILNEIKPLSGKYLKEKYPDEYEEEKSNVKNVISVINAFHDNKIPEAEQDWIYMIHHMHPPKSEEEIEELHHCILWEKENEKGKKYEIKHKKDSKVFQHRLDIDSQEAPDNVFDHLNNKYPIDIREIDKEKYAIITKPAKKIKHDDKAIGSINY